MSFEYNQELILGEIADFQKGFAFKSADFQRFGTKIIKVSNFTLDSIDEDRCVSIDTLKAKNYSRYELLSNDIVVTTVGSWPSNPASVVGKVVRVPIHLSHSLLNQNAVRIRAKLGINQHYLYYLLKSNYFKEYIIGTAQGSANQASITQNDIKNFKHYIPSLIQQKHIGEILKLQDDKIELNNAINKNLEKIAQTLFKRWFIDFEFPNENGEPYKSSGGEFEESELGLIPKGWSIGTIGEIAQARKQSIRPEKINKNTKYIGLEHIDRKSLALSRFGDAKIVESNKTLFEKDDILFGKLRPYFHKVCVTPYSGVCSTDILAIYPKDLAYYGLTVFYLFSDDLVNMVNKSSNGTRMPRTNWNTIASYKIAIPSVELSLVFSEFCKTVLSMINHNVRQSATLAELRDTLLPKLMSGELRVPLEEDAEAITQS